MTVGDVNEFFDECSRVIGKRQTVALQDGKMEGSSKDYKITSGEFWGCEGIKHQMLMNTDCRPLKDPDLSVCSA